MKRVKKNRKGKPSKADAAKIAAFRKAKNWTAQALADKLGLSGPNIVYAWESGAYNPAADNYIRMANLAAPDWKYIEWFLLRAGVEERTLSLVSDMLLHRSQIRGVNLLIKEATREFAEAMDARQDNVAISPLGLKGGQLVFPMWPLTNPASTLYAQLSKGELVFIDTVQTDVRELAEGSLVAIDSGVAGSPVVGILRKQAAGQNVEHYMLRSMDNNAIGDIFLGSSVSNRPPEFTRERLVLGRVVVWIQGVDKMREIREKK